MPVPAWVGALVAPAQSRNSAQTFIQVFSTTVDVSNHMKSMVSTNGCQVAFVRSLMVSAMRTSTISALAPVNTVWTVFSLERVVFHVS